MSQEDMRTKIEDAIKFLNENPAEARYTDSPATARLDDPEGLKVTVEGPDGARINTDMPTSVGGTNSTASSGWFLRAAEAACVATLISMRAAQLSVALAEVEVTVDSESDDRGILGADATVPAGPLSTRIAVRLLSSSADPTTLDEIARWAVEHCPVTDAVKRAIPMTIEVTTD